MEPILELKNVSKRYESFQLDHMTFQLPKGAIMGLIGENGAGKTTTIKSILNMIHFDGDVLVFGKDIRKNEKEIKEDIGVVLSDSSFPQEMTAIQIDQVLQDVYQHWDSGYFFSYCEQFQLSVKKKIKEYSRGMKMKIQIACALSHHPKLLILDEATSGLDPVVRDEILDVFLDFIQDEEHSVLLSSHITSDIEKVADYVTFIHQGKLLISEEKDILLQEYAILRATPEQLSALSNDDIAGYRKGSYSIDVLIKHRDQIKRRFPDAVIDSASLEDILLYSVKGVK